MAADDERAYFAEGSADENIATSLKCAAMSICARDARIHAHKQNAHVSRMLSAHTCDADGCSTTHIDTRAGRAT